MKENLTKRFYVIVIILLCINGCKTFNEQSNEQRIEPVSTSEHVVSNQKKEETKRSVISTEELKKGVVKITSDKTQGTGFIVHENQNKVYIVTLAHVIQKNSNPKVEFFENKVLTAKLLKEETTNDTEKAIALLEINLKDEVNKDKSLPPDIVTFNIVKEGFTPDPLVDEFFIIGFPISSGVKWSVDCCFKYSGKNDKEFQFSTRLEKGNSGSPVIQKGNDEVFAIITEILGQKSCAVSAQNVINFLKLKEMTVFEGMTQRNKTEVKKIIVKSEQENSPQKNGKPSQPLPEMVELKDLNIAIGKHEITFEEYDYFCEQTNREKVQDEGWGRDDKRQRPVINVSWNDAVAYTKWLSEETHEKYRLPTKEEWEYAARGGNPTSYRYPWGDKPDEACNYANVGDKTASEKCEESLKPPVIVNCDDEYPYTAKVGSLKPNGLGLYDMIGNVWEWVENSHDEKKLVKGGSWLDGGSQSLLITQDIVESYLPEAAEIFIGFRIVKELRSDR